MVSLRPYKSICTVMIPMTAPAAGRLHCEWHEALETPLSYTRHKRPKIPRTISSCVGCRVSERSELDSMGAPSLSTRSQELSAEVPNSVFELMEGKFIDTVHSYQRLGGCVWQLVRHGVCLFGERSAILIPYTCFHSVRLLCANILKPSSDTGLIRSDALRSVAQVLGI